MNNNFVRDKVTKDANWLTFASRETVWIECVDEYQYGKCSDYDHHLYSLKDIIEIDQFT